MWIIGIVVIAAVIASWHSYNNTKATQILRVAFPYSKPARFFEPTRIHLAPEYIFLENTFSTLVEVDPTNGDILPGAASEFNWQNDNLVLKIRSNLKTASGIPITATDVVFSLKRLLVLTGNTHGNLKSIVCGNVELENVEQDCPGIESNGNTGSRHFDIDGV